MWRERPLGRRPRLSPPKAADLVVHHATIGGDDSSTGAPQVLAKGVSESSPVSAAGGERTNPLIWVVPAAALLAVGFLKMLPLARRRLGDSFRRRHRRLPFI